MTTPEIMRELELMKSEQIRRILMNHGAPPTILGVKIEDLKKIQKKVKKDHELSLELYNSGVSDAQYLAGLIADEKKISEADLRKWADKANWSMLNEYIVPWITAESKYGWKLAIEWIDDPLEKYQVSGWSTLANLLAIVPDDQIDKKLITRLLKRVEKELPKALNRTRYVMNSFVISVGGYVPELTDLALQIANKLGPVKVNVGNTACKVPFAPDYIEKMVSKGVKKKKMARC
jgi:3-methyladenine DNA glycosylase AlkD